jgi:hypothetical protein
MILDFEIYNDYITEKLSVSLDVSDKTDDIVRHINQQLKNNGVKIIQTIHYDCVDVKKIQLDKCLTVDIFGCECIMNVDIYNLHINENGNIQPVLNDIGYDMDIQTHIEDVGGYANVFFTITGNLILYDMETSPVSLFKLSHELQHAYMEYKIYDGVPMVSIGERTKRNKKWLAVYNKCCLLLKDMNKDMKFDKDFYNVVYALYSCDVEEISAFTQQSYEECKGCSMSEYKDKLKTTMLYKLRYIFKNVLEFLDKQELMTIYNEWRNNMQSTLPSFDQVKKLIEKRYKKIKKNYGNVLVLLEYDLENKNTVELGIHN